MKIALVNTYDRDGGAARAALRLHHSLLDAGAESSLFVDQRTGNDPAILGLQGGVVRLVGRLRWQADHIPAQLAGARRGEFSVNWLGTGLHERLRQFAPDVIHLHWLNAGFVSLRELARLPAPVFWTAHDMWPFTGGCHYDAGCGRFAAAAACRPCPMQTRHPSWKLASNRFETKRALAERLGIHYIAPSRWMAGVAATSPVTRQGRGSVRVLPNAIDIERYKPIDRGAARALFGLPPDRKLLLFGGVLSNIDPRKGFALLDAALLRLASTRSADSLCLAVFGSAQRGHAQIHGIPAVHTGHLYDDESLIALYSAADIFVAPSLQDNLPNTVMEAGACGLPTVAFDIGGMADLIRHRETGWLAQAGDAGSLAEGIAYLLQDDERRKAAGRAAMAHVKQQFAYPVVAAAHLAAYRHALAGSP